MRNSSESRSQWLRSGSILQNTEDFIICCNTYIFSCIIFLFLACHLLHLFICLLAYLIIRALKSFLLLQGPLLSHLCWTFASGLEKSPITMYSDIFTAFTFQDISNPFSCAELEFSAMCVQEFHLCICYAIKIYKLGSSISTVLPWCFTAISEMRDTF